MFGFYETYIPKNSTYCSILIFLYVIEVTCIFFRNKLKIKKNNELLPKQYNWRLLNIILIICNIILFIFVIRSFPYLLQGFSTLREAYLAREINSNKVQMFISIVIFPLGHAAGLFAIIEYIFNRKHKLSLALYLLFGLQIVLMTAGRGHLLMVFSLIMFAIIDKYHFM